MTELRATYRLQLRREFTLHDAAQLVPYLSQLGISHIYLSPVTQAVPGSTHGYDVVDPTRVNSELGGQEAFDQLVASVAAHGMGLIVDIVPNHMAIAGPENRWWWDVLRHGRKSEFAKFFDIDRTTAGQIILPVLGDHYGRVLERGELQLREADDGYVIQYFDNAFPVDPETLTKTDLDIDELDMLIGAQHYRLAYWRISRDELDYRRFFDINSLIALRNEDSDVFEATHYLIAGWLKRELVDGVRIDHIDGLRDPLGYLHRLRAVSPNAWIGVEKILEPREALPATWPVQGTTGYDSARIVDGLFVEPGSEPAFNSLYQHWGDWETVSRESKEHVLQNVLGSDVARLTDLLACVCKARRRFRDFTSIELRSVIEAVLIAMPVYRTYVVAEKSQVTDSDMSILSGALAKASSIAHDIDGELFDLLRSLFALQLTGEAETEFVMKFQQVSGPVRAKSIEDTAFYRYTRFVALNEVGSDPSHWSTRLDDFHEFAARTQRLFPQALNAASTHDSKRSADVRSRLAVLSEMPEQWGRAVDRWTSMNSVYRRNEFPDRPTEYLIYQTLVGTYPLTQERALEYVIKVVREAKVHTSWTSQNETYESAIEQFVRALFASRPFNDDLDEFVKPVIEYGYLNSLAATTLRFTMPGVPDTYQGDELWNFALVDPDNRSQVDYALRRSLLETDDAPKLRVVKQCAALRLRRGESFGDKSPYIPLIAMGDKAAHVVAFARDNVAVVVPRLVVGLGGDWGDTSIELDSGTWQNVFTQEVVEGGRRELSGLLASFPVAVLERIDT